MSKKKKLDTDQIIQNYISRFGSDLCVCKNPTHDACTKISTDILKDINNGVVFNDQFINKYVEYLFGVSRTRNYYNQKFAGKIFNHHFYDRDDGNVCINKQDIHLPVFKELLKYLSFPVTHIDIENLYHTSSTIQLTYILDIMRENNQVITHDWLNYAYVMQNQLLMQYLVTNGLNQELYITDLLNDMLLFGWIGVATELINHRTGTDDETVEIAVCFGQNDFVRLLLTTGVKLSETILEHACKHTNEDIMKLCLENKIVPNEKCFNALISYPNGYSFQYSYLKRLYLETNSKNILSKSSSYWYKTEHDIKMNGKLVADRIETLIAYGYKVTYENVLSAIEHKKYVNDIERFNIKLDEKYLEACSKAGYYPYESDVLPGVACLEKECLKSGNLTVIRQLFVKNPSLKPSKQCLINACTLKSNLQTLKFLVSKGGVLDIECVNAFITQFGNSMLQYIMNEAYTRYKEVKIPEVPVVEPVVEPIPEPVVVEEIKIDAPKKKKPKTVKVKIGKEVGAKTLPKGSIRENGM